MNETSVGNSTVDSSSDSFEIQTQDLRKLENWILTCVVIYALVIFTHYLAKTLVKGCNKKTWEDEQPAIPTALSKLTFTAELIVILFSLVFCAYYFIKYGIQTSCGCMLPPFLTLLLFASKGFTEIQTILMSLFPISTYLSHLTKTGWEWTEPVTGAVIRAIGYFVFIKEYVMISWVFGTYYFIPEYTPQVIHFFFGVHLSLQFLLLLPVIVQFTPGSKPMSKMSDSEKMAFTEALLYVTFKLPVLVNVLVIASTHGTNHGMPFVCYIVVDIFLLFISVRYLELCLLINKLCKRCIGATDSIIYEMKPGKI